MLRLSSILAVLVFAAVALASSRGFIESLRPHVIPSVSRDRLPALTTLLGEHLDRILPDGSIRILADDRLLARLQAEGIEVLSSVDQPRMMMEALRAASTPQNPLLEYHDYNELTALLRQYAAAYPNITQLFSIGQSVSNRELWVIRITDNPTQKEAEPEVVYFGNMHGDEAVGREMLLNLVILLTESYGRDEALTNLVDTTDIYILASLNPDGFERARRANDNGFDLNRNFPDQWTDPGNDPTGRQPETRALMAFWAEHNFVLGANFHGGAVCVNYPYDGLENSSGCGREISYSPDHDLYVSLSLTYSKLNEPMYNSREFTDGITNGAEWYCIYGSAQDWSYVYHGTLHVTVELSNTKFPAASALAGFWEDNRDSMVAYLQEVHKGLKGRVVEKSTGLPVKASISVKRLDDNHVATPIGPNTSSSHQDGTYFRVLLPGTYQVKVTPASKALLPKTVTVQVQAGAPTVLDFEF